MNQKLLAFVRDMCDVANSDPGAAREVGLQFAIRCAVGMNDEALKALVNSFLSCLAVERRIWVNPKK